MTREERQARDLKIAARVAGGWTHREVALMFGLAPSAISAIVKRLKDGHALRSERKEFPKAPLRSRLKRSRRAQK